MTTNSTTNTGRADFSELLDLFSTSPTKEDLCPPKPPKKCWKNAPVIAIPPQDGRPGRLYQSCCNDWNCPRCGELRAKHEYGRIIEGARSLQTLNPEMYMLTLTCKGNEDLTTSEANFGKNTAQFWDALRIQAKRNKKQLAYVAITERQTRGHPHIHAITNYAPPDTIGIVDNYDLYCEQVLNLRDDIPIEMWFNPERLRDENNDLVLDWRQCWSSYAALQSVRSGLGVQTRIALIDAIEGASRYIAKYLFKALQDEKFPKHWKRVRYSQSWPKLEKPEATSAFVVLSRWDWWLVRDYAETFQTNSFDVFTKARRYMCDNVQLEREEK